MKIVEIIRENKTKRVGMVFEKPSKTRQEFKDDCDLGLVIKRFSRTEEGRLALENAQGYLNGRFEDVSNVQDYRSSLEQIKRADEAFERLPAAVRKRFQNDAAEFLDFVDNPANLDEMIKMGLAKPKEVVPPVSPPSA